MGGSQPLWGGPQPFWGGPSPSGGGPHLEELHPDAGEHELQQRGDDHDVADGADGHEDALHHVLGGGGHGDSVTGVLGTLGCPPSASQSLPVLPSPSQYRTFSPLARLMARRGRSTRSTRRIFTTEMALELPGDTGVP